MLAGRPARASEGQADAALTPPAALDADVGGWPRAEAEVCGPETFRNCQWDLQVSRTPLGETSSAATPADAQRVFCGTLGSQRPPHSKKSGAAGDTEVTTPRPRQSLLPPQQMGGPLVKHQSTPCPRASSCETTSFVNQDVCRFSVPDSKISSKSFFLKFFPQSPSKQTNLSLIMQMR